jgi:hypothetical protein
MAQCKANIRKMTHQFIFFEFIINVLFDINTPLNKRVCIDIVIGAPLLAQRTYQRHVC